MRILLFCENAYAIDILRPIHDEAVRQGCHEVLWYIHEHKIKSFPYDSEVNATRSMQQCFDFSPEAIFVPGNIVPYYLPGVKVQVFHGYAAEKKDHWVIRRYFDTYFTQGPFFTEHFKKLALRYGDFEVTETGWTKQDWIKANLNAFNAERDALLSSSGKKRIALYAPTFSPKLTSIPKFRPGLEKFLRDNPDWLLLIKFHPLTRTEWADEYRSWADGRNDIVYVDKSHNITDMQLMSDLVISDTSSAVYEFLLLDRPVVTLDTIARDIYWENITDPLNLGSAVKRALTDDDSIARRRFIRDNYDPYLDGLCCRRMIAAAEDYIRRHGIPRRRKVNLWRRYSSIKTFGRVKTH